MEAIKKYWFIPVLIIIGIALYVGMKNGLPGLLSNMFGGTTAQKQKEISDLDINRSNLTISDSDAILISQQLMACMDQWGTDTDGIKRLLQGRNRDDLLLIIKTFGIQPYNGLGLSQTIDKFLYTVDLNLQGWLMSELNGSDLTDITNLFKQNNIAF
ncbi:MAG: hypothetical protein WCR20_23780 [Verrucomicrobiota bacterium]